jgi:hypothetical protein
MKFLMRASRTTRPLLGKRRSLQVKSIHLPFEQDMIFVEAWGSPGGRGDGLDVHHEADDWPLPPRCIVTMVHSPYLRLVRL